jgi:hypothetical protein
MLALPAQRCRRRPSSPDPSGYGVSIAPSSNLDNPNHVGSCEARMSVRSRRESDIRQRARNVRSDPKATFDDVALTGSFCPETDPHRSRPEPRRSFAASCDKLQGREMEKWASGVESNALCLGPGPDSSDDFVWSSVHTKGFGSSLVSWTKRLVAPSVVMPARVPQTRTHQRFVETATSILLSRANRGSQLFSHHSLDPTSRWRRPRRRRHGR